MKMEHYLCHTNYLIWQVIQNGNCPVSVTIDTNGTIKVLPPKIAEEVVARERKRKARTTLLMALPEDHLAKFHNMADAKEIWEATKSRFGDNDESKKMQKYLLKQQFEAFSVSASEGLHKVALIMRTKPGLDTLSFDDLYNNLRVFERYVKGPTASSSSNSQNMAFVFADNISSTNDVSTAYSVSSPSVSKSQKEGFASYTDDVIHSFFSNKSSAPQLDYDDLEQINDDDLEEMDLKWQVAMISMRIKKFYKRTGRKLQFDTKDTVDSRRRDGGYNGNKARDNSRRPTHQDDSKDLVTIDGEDIDWSGHVEEDIQNFAMMAYCSSNSSSDNKSVFMNKECDLENTSVNDRYAKGMHAAPPPMTGNYMPYGPDIEIDYSKFTYGPKQTSIDESDAKTCENASSESNFSVETMTSMPDPVDNTPKVASEPKVWTDAPIIEEYESDSDNDSVENVKETGTLNHYSKIKKQDRHSHTRKGLGYARKSCFICGSFSHLIRDCDFHEKRMAKQAALTKGKENGNKAHLADYQEFKGSYVAFGDSNGRITGKGKIKAGMLDFEDVYCVEELKHYNLFSVSQMCDKKNKVIFTDIDYLVLSPDFKLLDENQALLKIPRQHNINAKTPQQNGVAERKNRTLIEAARTMLADSFLPTTFWAEAVNTACYVLNRVLVTKPQNKTPYELLTGTQPIISYLRPFGCHVIILNTIDQLGKFNRKSNSGFLVGYSLNNKAFKVYNLETKRAEENLHVNFLENKPNVVGKGYAWMFDLEYLTNSMNYKPVSLQNQANKSVGPQEANNSAGTQANDDQGANSEDINLHDKHFVLPIWSDYSTSEELEKLKRQEKEANDAVKKEATHDTQDVNTNITNLLNAIGALVSAVGPSRALNDDEPLYHDDPSMPHLEDIFTSLSEEIFTNSSYHDEGVVTDFNNLETTVNVSPTPTTRIHTIHSKTQILGDPMSAVQTRRKVKKNSEAHALNPKRSLKHWKMKVGLMLCKRNYCSSKFRRNKKDERGVVVRNKTRLVAQGHKREEGIDYDEVFAHVARIEAIRIFLAFAFYIGFIVYQMDVKSAFMYGTIDEEVYETQPPGFVDPKFPNKVYKVVKALYGLHQAPRAWYATLSTFLERNGYRKGVIDKTLFIKQDKKDIMLVQVYVDDIIFGSTTKSWCDEFKELKKNSVKTASTPIENQKPLVKDEEAADVDVTPKTSHLQAVKRIFRYLKGQLKLGLWYPKVSSFNLEPYLDSDYAGANLDRKSTIGCCQFLSRRLISWQCKKQTIMATSTTEAEYVAVAH
uniref:Integrase catalytic domain-containing protein n=1 Tax=Tanacetum cinerariifolium TaxID=118510 RepID=A0A6L2MY90_TANCI|nr:hypothetical protein [Tanacetum cinerariifolium]